MHGSVTADFAVSNKHDDFTLTEERMARERVAKDMRLEEQRRVREALLRERQELEKQRERDGRSERQALQQKSQAPEQRGKSMFERGWSALKNFRGPEALVVTAHQRKDKDSPWKQTSQTEIRPEDLKNGAIAAVRGVRSTITGAATGAATVAKNVGAGAGFMASGWKDGATYPSDAAIAAARFMMNNEGGSIRGGLKGVQAAASLMAPSGPPTLPSRDRVAGVAKYGAEAAAGAGSAAGQFIKDALKTARDTSVAARLR